ncbi:MAG: isoprenylcysteine carboxylmethyltransferase family protein [Acidobacteriota bacterium]|nr:isoprenylcysteine carboxylmethyltransferase family protein [Acidobacteriota bacterium]
MTLYKNIVIGCWIVMILYWFLAAWSAKRTVERQSWGSRLILVLVAIGAVELAMLQTILRRVPPLLPRTPLVAWVGVAVCFAGLAFTLWARRTLGRNWSGWVTFKEDHELVRRGPYAFVRHPIYTGVLAMFLGTAIVWNNAQTFLGFVVVFLVLWIKSRQEEAMMLKHFPDQYPQYKARVKGLIPFIF